MKLDLFCGKREPHGPHEWSEWHDPPDPKLAAHCHGWQPSRASRTAALPIRALDWLLRKAIR